MFETFIIAAAIIINMKREEDMADRRAFYGPDTIPPTEQMPAARSASRASCAAIALWQRFRERNRDVRTRRPCRQHDPGQECPRGETAPARL